MTAARSGEARAATWDEIDTAAKVWTIPPARMKAGREHRVLLRASELAGDSPFVFPTRAGRALSSKSTYRVLQLAGVTGTTLLLQAQRDHLRRIQEGSVVELMDILFASGRRSIESLLLALPTTDRIISPAASNLIQEGADGSIRLFGSRKRLSTHPSSSQNSVPGYVAGYLTAVAQQHGLTPTSYIDDVINHLSACNCLNTAHFYLDVTALCLQPAGASFSECTQCRRIHLHPSGDICADCWSPLDPPQPMAGAHRSCPNRS